MQYWHSSDMGKYTQNRIFETFLKIKTLCGKVTQFSPLGYFLVYPLQVNIFSKSSLADLCQE